MNADAPGPSGLKARTLFFAFVAIVSGLFVLLGYFLDIPSLVSVRTTLLNWAMLVGGVAVIVGVLNLLSVHTGKIKQSPRSAVYSVVLLVAFFVTLILGIVDIVVGPAYKLLNLAVSNIQIPVESSLLAGLVFVLVYIAIRLLRRRMDAPALAFLVSAVIFLVLGSGIALQSGSPMLTNLSETLNRLPIAGGRGILLGIALGSLATGLRILFGADRPYGD
jgi:hypothetical protein